MLLVLSARAVLLNRHWYRMGVALMAATVKVALLPSATVRDWGCCVMTGLSKTVTVQGLLR